MKLKNYAIAWLCALTAMSAMAQTTVNETRPASANGLVSISNVAGSVEVAAWDKPEIQVTGDLEENMEPLEFTAHEGRAVIEAKPKKRSHSKHAAHLTIHVPASSSVEVSTVSADVRIDIPLAASSSESPEARLADSKAHVQAETVSGKIVMDANAESIDAHSVSGNIELKACTARLEAQSVSGAISVFGIVKSAECETTSGRLTFAGSVDALEANSVSGSVVAETVGKSAEVTSFSGKIELTGAVWDRGDITSTSGSVTLRTGLSAQGKIEVDSVSGGIELQCPKETAAEFELSSVSGALAAPLGAGAGVQEGKGSLRFTMGDSSARVKLSSVSGGIRITSN